jgi:hypothetical protein
MLARVSLSLIDMYLNGNCRERGHDHEIPDTATS